MPLSPRETRRSRRSVPSGSSANSNSPEPAPPPPSRVGSRKKAMKQEEADEEEEEVAPNPRKRGGASKRTTKDSNKDKEEKGHSPKSRDAKEKDKDGDDDTVLAKEEDEEEEEQGITRCVCGSTEDDPDAGEFMVQCETCKVWQHGLCMGYESEDQLHDDDYYCEMCRPDMHTELLSRRKVSRSKARQISRSHSPTLSRQPAKRRNTMNSRDAAFDENLKEILESTAAEAGDEGETSADSGTKKRKRPAAPQPPTEDEPQPPPKKRVRSASVASEVVPEAPQKKSQRGGKRTKTDETVPVPKRNTGRGKGGASKRATTASAPPAPTAVADTIVQDEPTPTPAPLPTKRAAGTPAENKAYRNSHAYVVSQQPLLTSWGLPDYLAHLENIFPTHHPIPLEVGGVQERGVKTKWPGKRMSVGDMNKRVRALVEWVGREQVQAQDRARRREALVRAVQGDQMDVQTNGNGQRPSSVAPKDGSETKTMKLMEELMDEMLTFQERFSR
ncbi:hypothetical protein CYLTODRAFT_485815 [Cylindrobasidium torrendii FP15055 ss-10]|uniref:PHD-type domain-containing protein n=1 Tax=Cylindrobasidium torrendii FP15055 ss-10 TaxID=1314674 RepID=A0A0D7BU03_9AGAR|nr:hypothetical protein CYLTODRAFT_485815 [Cylindrobasidium torrendii FP15055 ss-10]